MLDAEFKNWPASVVTALTEPYFFQASDQIGVTDTNDFIYGRLAYGSAAPAVRRPQIGCFRAARHPVGGSARSSCRTATAGLEALVILRSRGRRGRRRNHDHHRPARQ